MAGSGDEIKASPRRPPTFDPLRPATSGWRAAVLIAGPLLWVASLVLVAYVLRHGEAVQIALIVVVASLLVSILVLVPARARRVRDEERA